MKFRNNEAALVEATLVAGSFKCRPVFKKTDFKTGPLARKIYAILGLGLTLLIIGTCKSEDYMPGISLVCFGDSLTAGYGATIPGEDDKTKSYPAFLEKKVNIQVVNAGVTGDTTILARARLERDVISKFPQIVIIELGANDLLKFVSPSVTASNLSAIIESLNDGRRKIYLVKFFTPELVRDLVSSVGIRDFGLQDAVIAQYDALYSSVAAKYGVELINDIWSGVWGVHMSDIIHPNAAGYEIMAEKYFAALKPYLQIKGLLK